MREKMVSLSMTLVIAACGGSAKAPETAETEASSAQQTATSAESAGNQPESESASDASTDIPVECHKDAEPCTPPPEFVRRLCQDSYPGVALYMFSKSSPWMRAYLTRKTKAWNAAGGVSDSDAWLEFDEEVIVLARRDTDLGGMQVSGATGGIEALRWNGSCVTLAAEEVTMSRAPAPKAAAIEWRYLDEPIRESLREDESVNQAYREHRAECKGVTSGVVSLKCVKADTRLKEVIVEYVRNGGKLAKPLKLP